MISYVCNCARWLGFRVSNWLISSSFWFYIISQSYIFTLYILWSLSRSFTIPSWFLLWSCISDALYSNRASFYLKTWPKFVLIDFLYSVVCIFFIFSIGWGEMKSILASFGFLSSNYLILYVMSPFQSVLVGALSQVNVWCYCYTVFLYGIQVYMSICVLCRIRLFWFFLSNHYWFGYVS